jgi:DNA-directed RNA polymerase specialized sigma24 family protein
MTMTTTDEWLASLEDGHAEAKDGKDLRGIGEALQAVDAAQAELVAAVATARGHGRSWTEVANVLGVSRQAARQRFADAVDRLMV